MKEQKQPGMPSHLELVKETKMVAVYKVAQSYNTFIFFKKKGGGWKKIFDTFAFS